MKVIALLPCKNESLFLPSYLNSVSKVADHLIVVNDQSTDLSEEILTAQNYISCDIHEPKKERGEDWSVDKIRQQLLDLGRAAGGTHFVCLDADECFTKNFKNKANVIFSSMKPGQKLQMQWLAMWKSVDHYKNDHSVWSNNFKDFVFCDDGKSNFISEAYFCDPRTPGENNDDTLLKLNPKHGAVMHFQFSMWNRFQTKQCWYRCRELLYGKSPAAINQKFAITLDDPNSIVTACDDSWIPEVLPDIEKDTNIQNNWHYQEIQNMFKEHGKEYFKNLNLTTLPDI